jgi:glycosyltransferase involved in cell wall biosynthesis
MLTSEANASFAQGVRPAVAVCVLVYNHAHVVEATLRTILDQTITDCPIYVSDDFSADGTWDILMSLARREPRVMPIRTRTNLGMAGNANFAISNINSEFVALLHHDDIYHPTLLQEWLRVARLSPSVAFVFNDYLISGNRVVRHQLPEVIDGRTFKKNHLLAGWACPVRGTALVRKSCWDAVGGMSEEFGLLADIDMWMRLSDQWDVGHVNAALIEVRHSRPSHYPAEYQGFSWQRIRLLYLIHAKGWATMPSSKTGVFDRFRFRWRVSIDVLKWMAYGVFKRRSDILAQAAVGSNEIEYSFVKLVRQLLMAFVGAHNETPRG